MLAGAPADRPHLDAMPGARNRIAEPLRALHGALAAERVLDSADGAFIVPCRERVLSGDRIRCTVSGSAARGFLGLRENLRIEGEVERVLPLSDEETAVRITACSDERGPKVGSDAWFPMRALLEYGCARMLREDEEERARDEERARRKAMERERVLAEPSLDRHRAIDRGEDYDLSM